MACKSQKVNENTYLFCKKKKIKKKQDGEFSTEIYTLT